MFVSYMFADGADLPMGNLQIPSQPRKLSFNEKGQLVDKLLDCLKMRDRHARDMIVQELSFAGSIPRHEADKDDVRNILNTSLNYEGSLQELVDVIATFEKDELGRDSLSMQRLSEFLELLFSSPESIAINVDLLGKLYKLTANVHVSKNELHNMYRRSVVDGQLPHKYQSIDESKTLSLMIQDLAQKGLQSTYPQNKLTHPLLTFIKLLSRCVPDPMRDELMQWREEMAAKEHIALEEESNPAIGAEQLSEGTYYLLVKFKPGNNKDAFELHAWLICEQNGKTVPVNSYVKEEATLEEIPSLFDELISQCQEHTDTFTIELFLPFALLNGDKDDVHTWRLDLGFDTIAVSHKYPLVVRSYDRVYGVNKIKPEVRRRLRQAWEDNWAICKNCGEARIQWPLKEKDYVKENLVAWLQGVACLTMVFVPPAFDAVQPHIFKTMMSAGSSVALWPRPHHKCLNEEAIEQAYHGLLVGCHFSKLPKMIWERRIEAAMDETLLANHLTLFWDNPYRLPSDAPDAPIRDKYPLVAPR